MLNNWLKNCSIETAERLTEINTHNVNPDMPCGSGLKNRVIHFINYIRTAMYPNIYYTQSIDPIFVRTIACDNLHQAALLLYELCHDVLNDGCGNRDCRTDSRSRLEQEASRITVQFLQSIPAIAEILVTDIQAAYEGDPAARSTEEIQVAYPAFEAISIFRLAHRLFELQVPLLPRIMTEYAHQITGIDIHPGATIGRYFFIDHGTGVVIGETCVIGEHVKIYQGVTLGAKSFVNDENGNPVKGIKRHPNIGNNVVIYAGATILGGDTFIGDNVIIGGNVWLTKSVEEGCRVYNQLQVTKK